MIRRNLDMRDEMRPARRERGPGSVRQKAALRLLAVFFLLAAGAAADSARSLVDKGNEAYERGNYQEALAIYQAAGNLEPDSPEIWFNKGNALYQQGQYRKAMDAYEQAAVLAKDRSLEARGKFNQGNASFREGLQQAQTNPGEALDELQQSVRYYRDALRAEPDMEDARYNIEVARRLIADLREQMEQQPQNQKQQDKDREQDQNQQSETPPQSADQREQEQPQNAPDDPQQDQQQQQQAQQQQREQAGQEGEPDEELAKQILEEERENRRLRQLRAQVGMKPVDKDW